MIEHLLIVQSVIGSIPNGGSIELSPSKPVHHNWINEGHGYVPSCLWDGVYKRFLAANQKEKPM